MRSTRECALSYTQTSVSQNTSILCHSPSSKLFLVFTLSSNVPEPKSISNRGWPLSNSIDIKSVGNRKLFRRWSIDHNIVWSVAKRMRIPDTSVSSGSGGTIGPLYNMRPSAFRVTNSRLRWELSHMSKGGYHAQPLPLKLLAVCWHLGPLKPEGHSHVGPFLVSVHRPPFKQGLDRHVSIFVKLRAPQVHSA